MRPSVRGDPHKARRSASPIRPRITQRKPATNRPRHADRGVTVKEMDGTLLRHSPPDAETHRRGIHQQRVLLVHSLNAAECGKDSP